MDYLEYILNSINFCSYNIVLVHVCVCKQDLNFQNFQVLAEIMENNVIQVFLNLEISSKYYLLALQKY